MSEPQNRIQRCVFIDKSIWKQFKEICVREDEAISDKLEEYMRRYISVHDEGNPQLRMDKYVKPIEDKVCFFCQGHFPNLRKVQYASGLVAPTCSSCLSENKAKGSFSTVKNVLG